MNNVHEVSPWFPYILIGASCILGAVLVLLFGTLLYKIIFD